MKLDGYIGANIRLGAGGGASTDNALSALSVMGGKYHVVINDDASKQPTEQYPNEKPLSRHIIERGGVVAARLTLSTPGDRAGDDDADAKISGSELARLQIDHMNKLGKHENLWGYGGNELGDTQPARQEEFLIQYLDTLGHSGYRAVVGNYSDRNPTYDLFEQMPRAVAAIHRWGAKVGFHEGAVREADTYEKAVALGTIGRALHWRQKYGFDLWLTEFAGTYDAFAGYKRLYAGRMQVWYDVLRKTALFCQQNNVPLSIFTLFEWEQDFAFYNDARLLTEVGSINTAYPYKEQPVTYKLPDINDPRWQEVSTTTTTNVRSSPEVKVGNTIATTSKGQVVKIITDAAATVKLLGYIWLPVLLATGSLGWARQDALGFVPVSMQVYDMRDYVFPRSGKLYRLSSDEVTQVVYDAAGYARFIKNGLWEEGWADEQYVWRGLDISSYPPAAGAVIYSPFVIVEGRQVYGAPWLRRYMRKGEIFPFTKYVQHFAAVDGRLVDGGAATDYMLLKNVLPVWTSPSGRVMYDVAVLQWSRTPDFSRVIEEYYYAKGYGLVQFWDGRMATSFITTDTPVSLRLPTQQVSWFSRPAVPPTLIAAPPTPPKPTPPIGREVTRKLSPSASVNLRAATSPSAGLLTRVPAGALVGVIFTAEKIVANGYEWCWVDYSGYSGYMARVFPTWEQQFLSAASKQLDVPYASQWGHASGRTGLCGPTSSWMVFAWDCKKAEIKRPVEATVDRFGDWIGMGASSFSSLQQNVDVLLAYGVRAKSTAVTLSVIEAEIDAGRPVICLGKYSHLSNRADKTFGGGHILVAVGYSASEIICHDPDYSGSAGAFVAYRRDEFEDFLGEVSGTGNAPNRGIVVTGGRHG